MRVGLNGIWIFLRINTLVKIITISSNVIGASAALYITYLRTIVIGWCNRAVGCNQTPVIGQLKQPIILSPLS